MKNRNHIAILIFCIIILGVLFGNHSPIISFIVPVIIFIGCYHLSTIIQQFLKSSRGEKTFKIKLEEESFEKVPKKTRYKQSVEFSNDQEQFYYDEIRTQMRTGGLKTRIITPTNLEIPRFRYDEIVKIAQSDYLSVLTNPFF